VPLYPWLPALTLLLYFLVLVIVVWTQPALALGAGAMLAALWIAGWIVAKRLETR
jgi:hypothetical protein